MELMCPQCHTNNQGGAERVAGTTRFVCSGCATEFDAVVADGVCEAVPPRDVRPAPPPSADPESTDDFLPEDFFDIFNTPRGPSARVRAEAPQSRVPGAVFMSATPADEESKTQLAAAATDAAAGEVDPFHVTEAAGERAVYPAASPWSHDEAASAAAEPSVNPVEIEPPAVGHVAPPAYDKYAVGMRVLRISPVWLLLSSAGFFAVLLTLSWMSKPVVPVGEVVAAMGERVPNEARSPAPGTAPAAPEAMIEAAKAAAERALPPAAKAAAKPAGEANITPAPPQVAPGSGPGEGSGRYTVQVGSFSDPSEANLCISQLRAAGFEASAASVELPQRGTWYRVQAGRFETREEAAKAGAQMRAGGVAAAFIVTEVGAR